jgi:hypothetical protein
LLERPAGTLEPCGCSPRVPTWHSISRRRVVDVAAALGLPLPALVALAVAAWLVRSTLAVAHLREAPTSSASISVTDRLSPSGISQPRWRSRPVTMTRSPL